MIRNFQLFALSCTLLAAQAFSYAVPFTANTPDFAVSTMTSTVSVVCTATASVTCQAVRIKDSNQTILGVSKVVDYAHDYADVETIPLADDLMMVCYATSDVGSKCAQYRVDENFGLMGDALREFSFCSQQEKCYGLALEKTNVAGSYALCYGVEEVGGACTLIKQASSKPTLSRKIFPSVNSWDASVALTLVPNGPLLMCVVTISENEEQSGKCDLIDDQAFDLIPQSETLDLGAASIVSAVYTGKVNGRERLTVCYLLSLNEQLYCAAVYILQDKLMVSSRGKFPAPYSYLDGLKLQRLSDDDTSFAVIGCLSTLEEGSDELVCTLISTTAQGVISVNNYEMVVDPEGLYLQNVPQALASISPVGAYLESSEKIESPYARPVDDDEPLINEAVVLPDLNGVFAGAASLSVSSVGCVNVGLSDLDATRFCVATEAKLNRPPPPTMPFPPLNLCNVKLAWECEARKEYCVRVGTTCISKYACSGQNTAAKCNALAAAGGLCEMVNGKCTPTYGWDPKSMCQTVPNTKLCNRSPDCIWAANACRMKPYCQIAQKKQCKKSPGCLWVNNRCGVANK